MLQNKKSQNRCKRVLELSMNPHDQELGELEYPKTQNKTKTSNQNVNYDILNTEKELTFRNPQAKVQKRILEQ